MPTQKNYAVIKAFLGNTTCFDISDDYQNNVGDIVKLMPEAKLTNQWLNEGFIIAI